VCFIFLVSNDVVTFTLDLLRCVHILKLDGHASVILIGRWPCRDLGLGQTGMFRVSEFARRVARPCNV